MLASLERIQHPLVRSLTAATAVGAALTLTSAVIIGITHTQTPAAFRNAVYASLVGAGIGAGVGFVPGRSIAAKATAPATPAQSDTWTDWRTFVVVRKVKESEEITSFYLKPQDQGAIPRFEPGQFLTIKLEIPGQPRPIIRTYSLSDYPESGDYYRLSIKREPMPDGLMVPPGLASNFMHDHVQEGAIIPAKPPAGRFILDISNPIPAVLISNGVGITPMIAMAKAAGRLNPDRPIWFVHGTRDRRFHAFREEVLAIAQQYTNLNVHFVYSRPRSEDEGCYHSVGYADAALIQRLIGSQDAEYFLCGSPAFMQSLREGLKQSGVPDYRVAFEMFTKAGTPLVERPMSTLSADAADAITVSFAQSAQTIAWDATQNSLLDFAEANGLNPPYSCRQGICGTCACKLLEGEVAYQETPTAAVADGSVLICISQPKTASVVLDL